MALEGGIMCHRHGGGGSPGTDRRPLRGVAVGISCKARLVTPRSEPDAAKVQQKVMICCEIAAGDVICH